MIRRAYIWLVFVLLVLPGWAQTRLPASSGDSVGPRKLEEETRSAVIRDYLQAWESLGQALSENRPAVLDQYFVGIAKDGFLDTVREQQQLGISSGYRDQNHDLRIVFYSPDGLSIQLVDNVEYRMEIRDHERVVDTQPVRSRYVAVMTPTEAKWKVRILQAQPQ